MTSNRLKVLIVDDHALVLHGFALSVLELFPDAEVLEANSLEGALATVRRNPDLSPSSLRSPFGQRRWIDRGPPDDRSAGGVPLIVISASDESADVIDSVRAGAKGYILKSGSSALLEHAISLVLSGETYVPLPRTVLVSAVGGAGAADQPCAGPVDRAPARRVPTCCSPDIPARRSPVPWASSKARSRCMCEPSCRSWA